MERRAIQVLTRCTKFGPISDTRHGTGEPKVSDYYDHMWHFRLAQHMKAASEEYAYECWGMDQTLNKRVTRDVSGITVRLFPCKKLRYVGEFSQDLIHDLKREARKQDAILHFHELFTYQTLLTPLAIKDTPMIVQHHGGDSLKQQSHHSTQKTHKLGALVLYALTGQWLLERVSLPRFDRIFVLNKEIERYVVRFAGADRVQRLTMGIDFDFFAQTDKHQARKTLGLEPDIPYILYLGHLRAPKGVDYLLKALPAIIKEYPESVLLFVGTGYLRERLVQLAEELEISSRVTFRPSDEDAPRVATDVLPLYYSAADVVVVPSLREGLSIGAVEALACERPLVASNVGGLPEVVAAFKAGVLVRPRSPEALSKAIVDVLSGKQSFTFDRENARRVFDWTSIAERNLEVYDELFDQYYGKTSNSDFKKSRTGKTTLRVL